MNALVITLQCGIADVAATFTRHSRSFLNLAWAEHHGRGGHVGWVALGLGVTFAALAATGAAVSPLPIFVALVAGIQGWVTYDALVNPAHEGHRGEVLVRETLRNASGSALCALLEPELGSFLGAAALNVALQTMIHYNAVLLGGWQDVGRGGLQEHERRNLNEWTVIDLRPSV